MRSKAEVIREELAGLSVLDIGGAGYGETNPYELQLRDAWSAVKDRTTLDQTEEATIQLDLNALPLAPLEGQWDITTAFDVLEHLEHPVEVLRWIPTERLLVSLPNAVSPLTRRMEERGDMEHLYSFTRHTAAMLLCRGGWQVEASLYTMGKWSLLSRLINAVGSLCPSRVATGIMLKCSRSND